MCLGLSDLSFEPVIRDPSGHIEDYAYKRHPHPGDFKTSSIYAPLLRGTGLIGTYIDS